MLVTLAELKKFPGLVGLTTRLTIVVAPLARKPRLQVTVGSSPGIVEPRLNVHVPKDELVVAEINKKSLFCGNLFVNTTAVAVFGPKLCT